MLLQLTHGPHLQQQGARILFLLNDLSVLLSNLICCSREAEKRRNQQATSFKQMTKKLHRSPLFSFPW
jgi:hypothetical protein